MQRILEKVLSDMKLRNYSASTKKQYLRVCGDYLAFLGDKPLDITMAAWEYRAKWYCEEEKVARARAKELEASTA